MSKYNRDQVDEAQDDHIENECTSHSVEIEKSMELRSSMKLVSFII